VKERECVKEREVLLDWRVNAIHPYCGPGCDLAAVGLILMKRWVRLTAGHQASRPAGAGQVVVAAWHIFFVGWAYYLG